MRRLKTIPTAWLLFVIASALVPVSVLAWLGAWALRASPSGPAVMAARLALFGWLYLLSEVIGMSALLVVWIGSGFGLARRLLLRGTYAVQRGWAGANLMFVQRIFELRFVVEGGDAVTPGPILLFVKHTSMPDTLLPTRLVTGRRGIRLRFVLKRELLVDPCLDLAGHWLPNCFIDRSGADTAKEVARIEALARSIGPRDGVLIYPEGSRFTRVKRRRALARIAARDTERRARVSRLRHSLPPRLGGPLALIDASPSADVVFMAHHGFEGFGSLRRIWHGGMVRKTIRVAFWREPRAAIPRYREERVVWLDGWWQRVDDWVAAGLTDNEVSEAR